MIKAVIFDIGGVLMDEPLGGMFSYISNILNVDKRDLENVYTKFAEIFEKGKISEKKLFQRICQELKIKEPRVNSLWREAYEKSYSENERVFSFAKELKSRGFKIGLLSNIEAPVVNFLENKDYKFFDVAVFSCVEGFRKPQKEIFEIILKRMKVKPEESILIDDIIENVEGAKKIGIKVVLFKDLEQIKKEVEIILKN